MCIARREAGHEHGHAGRVQSGLKLAAVVNGLSDEKVLDSYSTERSEVGEHVLADARRPAIVGAIENYGFSRRCGTQWAI